MMKLILTACLLPAALLSADEWKAPADACAVKNPVTASTASISQGKTIYDRNCLTCHGPTGQGDGAGAAYLNPRPAKLSDAAVQAQTDGALFWKISKGRNLMLGWAATISEADRWAMVTYLRSLAANP
jgi:mono/diheme cytochrome c family protein